MGQDKKKTTLKGNTYSTTKEKELKGYISDLAIGYFIPRPQLDTDGTGLPRTIEMRDNTGVVFETLTLKDKDGNPLVMPDVMVDLMQMSPKDRAIMYIKLLPYIVATLQAVSADFSVQSADDYQSRLEERLKELAVGRNNL